MTLKNGFGKCSLLVLLANELKDQDMASSFSRQNREGIVRLANRVAVWRQSEVLIDFWKVLGLEVFSAERSLNQPKATGFCNRSISQSNRLIFVRLLFLFCSSVFISWSYENRSNEFCLPPKFCLSYCLQMFLGKRSTQLPGAALYPDVSLSMKICAQRKAGRRETGFASLL